MWKRRVAVRAAAVTALLVPFTMPAANAASTFEQQLSLEMVAEVNEFRADNGVPALGGNGGLAAGAQRQTGAMVEAGDLFHASEDEMWASAENGGCGSFVGENVGYSWLNDIDPTAATEAEIDALAAEHTQQFMESPGHRDNILSDDFTHIGVGYEITAEGQVFFTQQFSADCDTIPMPGEGESAGKPVTTPSDSQTAEPRSESDSDPFWEWDFRDLLREVFDWL